VGAASYGRTPPAASSRYVEQFHRLPDPQQDADVFAGALNDTLASGGYEAIVACDDPTLARLNFLDWSQPSIPSTGSGFAAVTDKLVLADLAKRAGVDYPATFAATNMDEADAALDATGVPVIVKASRSATALPTRVLYSKGAVVAYDHNVARAAVKSLVAAGFRPILQERVFTRKKINAVVVRRRGTSDLRYAHHVLREIPSSGGMGITLQTASPDEPDAEVAIRALEAVCDAAGYEGLVQAELYLDDDERRAWLIDVNPRPWGSTWFVEKLGIRAMERALLAALGEPPTPPPAYPAGRRFRHVTSEFHWFRQERSRISSLVAVARDSRRGDVYEYLDGSDLRPLVKQAFLHVGRRTARPGRRSSAATALLVATDLLIS
jgi:hypothetical protein